jgi:hypothetical protein
MAAPTFQAVGTAVSGTGSVLIGWPSTAANDIGILVMETGGEGTTQTPAGWTHVPGSPFTDVASTAGSKLHVLWARATGPSMGNFQTGDSGDHQVARIFTFRGCPTTGDPWDVVATATKTTASTTATAPSVTTTVTDTRIVMIVGRPNDSASTTHFGTWTNANLSSITEHGEAGTTSGHGGGFKVGSGIFTASPGTTGTATATKIASTTDTLMTIALKSTTSVIPNSAPTVALNIPLDAGTVASTTPQVTFTGTDTESNDITYEVQVDTVNTFNSTSGIGSITESQIAGTSNTFFGDSDFRYAKSMSFTTTSAYSIKAIDFSLLRNGSPADNLYVELRSGSNTGTLLGTSDVVSGASVPTLQTWIQFVFLTPIALSNATKYYAQLKRTGAIDVSNKFSFHYDAASSYAGGGVSTYTLSTTTWSAESGSDDALFRVYSTGFVPLLDKFSNTDTGFTDITNGADTDPFASGDQVGYTIQAGNSLTNGNTYYWRVRGKDPSGSNSYGAWATTRSFTVSAGGTPTYLFFNMF